MQRLVDTAVVVVAVIIPSLYPKRFQKVFHVVSSCVANMAIMGVLCEKLMTKTKKKYE
jgi:hypothetical protein